MGKIVRLTENDLINLVKRVLDEQSVKETEMTEACWKGYTQKGMKTMFGKKYPNCVKKESAACIMSEISSIAASISSCTNESSIA